MDKESVEVTGLHHYVDGGESVVALEINGHWHEISRQSNDSPYSHIYESGYLLKAGEPE